MNPVSTPIKFSVGKDEFEVTQACFCKNGEVIEEGKMFMFNLLLGQPAWAICITNDFCPPTYIKTSSVTSVLPEFEIFEGFPHPQKFVFEILLLVDGQTQKVKILAVDEIHAKHLCLLSKGKNVEILSISKGAMRYATTNV